MTKLHWLVVLAIPLSWTGGFLVGLSRSHVIPPLSLPIVSATRDCHIEGPCSDTHQAGLPSCSDQCGAARNLEEVNAVLRDQEWELEVVRRELRLLADRIDWYVAVHPVKP
jgi:hypothetical protein